MLTDMKNLHNALRYDLIIEFDMEVARACKLWSPHEHFKRTNANLKKYHTTNVTLQTHACSIIVSKTYQFCWYNRKKSR